MDNTGKKDFFTRAKWTLFQVFLLILFLLEMYKILKGVWLSV